MHGSLALTSLLLLEGFSKVVVSWYKMHNTNVMIRWQSMMDKFFFFQVDYLTLMKDA